MYSFRNDYSEGAHPKVLKALTETNFEQTRGYGLDPRCEKARELIREKSPDLAAADAVAEQVGVGAIVFSALSSNSIKDMVFSYDKALNFDGESAPYLQYTHARCRSILAKA